MLQTYQQCQQILRDRGQLPDDGAVFHVIAPLTGGANHPDNYCVLPTAFPRFYLQSKAEAQMHNQLMAHLLDGRRVKKAITASMPAANKGGDYEGPDLNELKEICVGIRQNAFAHRQEA